MGAYQIGRIEEPWTNFTPPIRGGIFESVDHDNPEPESSVEPDLSPLNSSATGLDTLIDGHHDHRIDYADPSVEGSRPRFSSKEFDDYSVAHQSTIAGKATPKVLFRDGQTRKEYTSELVTQERDASASKYPSLDVETQRAIVQKYQALHERVKNEGFYDCPYTEYGKDAVRWVILFSLAVVALRSGWYITSAVFLGLFWVSPPLHKFAGCSSTD